MSSTDISCDSNILESEQNRPRSHLTKTGSSWPVCR